MPVDEDSFAHDLSISIHCNRSQTNLCPSEGYHPSIHPPAPNRCAHFSLLTLSLLFFRVLSWIPWSLPRCARRTLRVTFSLYYFVTFYFSVGSVAITPVRTAHPTGNLLTSHFSLYYFLFFRVFPCDSKLRDEQVSREAGSRERPVAIMPVRMAHPTWRYFRGFRGYK